MRCNGKPRDHARFHTVKFARGFLAPHRSGTCRKTLCFLSGCPWHTGPCTCAVWMDSGLQVAQRASQPVELLCVRAVTVVIFGVRRDCRGYPASLHASGGCFVSRKSWTNGHVCIFSPGQHSFLKKEAISTEVQKYESHLTSVNIGDHVTCYSLALILVAFFLILQRSSCHGSFQASSGSFSLETSSSGFPLWGKSLMFSQLTVRWVNRDCPYKVGILRPQRLTRLPTWLLLELHHRL